MAYEARILLSREWRYQFCLRDAPWVRSANTPSPHAGTEDWLLPRAFVPFAGNTPNGLGNRLLSEDHFLAARLCYT